MSRALEARLRRLEELLETAEMVEMEDGRRVPIAPGVLIDAWLALMASEPLPVVPSVRWTLALARVGADDWQMAQLRAAAVRELGEVTR